MLVSILFNICAFIINARDCRESYLNPSAINTTSQSHCISKKTTGPFIACIYSSDGLQVEDSYSSRVMSDINPSPVKSAYGRGGGRGVGRGGGRGGKGDYSNGLRTSHLQNRKTRPQVNKLKGNSIELEGYIFDCSNSKQADKFTTAIKRISEHVGTEYKYGGYICSSIENSTRFVILLPVVPADTANALTRTIAAKKIYLYVKRDGILDENLQKAYSLIFGLCTELLKSKLKSSVNWDTMSSTYDMFTLLEDIKTIIYKLEDQNYLPLSLHKAKINFYNFRQGMMKNPDYLDKFMNLTEMVESYEGTLHDAAVFKIALLTPNLRSTPEADLDEDERIIINAAAREIYLSCASIVPSDPKRYGHLVEKLENEYTKGNNNYPKNMVKAYQLINKYKSWNPRTSLHEVSGVAFSQSCSSPRWDNLPSGHQQNPLLGLFGKVHVLGSKILF